MPYFCCSLPRPARTYHLIFFHVLFVGQSSFLDIFTPSSSITLLSFQLQLRKPIPPPPPVSPGLLVVLACAKLSIRTVSLPPRQSPIVPQFCSLCIGCFGVTFRLHGNPLALTPRAALWTDLRPRLRRHQRHRPRSPPRAFAEVPSKFVRRSREDLPDSQWRLHAGIHTHFGVDDHDPLCSFSGTVRRVTG